jgi:hypothetical protein
MDRLRRCSRSITHLVSTEKAALVDRYAYEKLIERVRDTASRHPVCEQCGVSLQQGLGRPRMVCSNACRQAAYRARLRSTRPDRSS